MLKKYFILIFCLLISLSLFFVILPQSKAYAFSKSDYYAADRLYSIGQYDKSLERIDKYLAKNPEDIDGLSLKAWIFLKTNKMDSAKDIIDRNLKKNPNHLDTLVASGVYFRKMEEPEKAMAQYQKVLNINPNDSAALTSIVTVALQSGEIKKAVSYGEKAYQNDPTHPTVNSNLAIAYHYDKQYNKRDKHTQIAIKNGYHGGKTLKEIYAGNITIVPPELLKEE